MWFVGLCEGEACIDSNRGLPRIRVGMTDRDVVGRAATLMGVSVRLSLRRPPNNPVWCAEVTGARAAEILREILPHLGARRSAKAAAVLAAYEFRATTRQSIPGPQIVRPPALTRVGA